MSEEDACTGHEKKESVMMTSEVCSADIQHIIPEKFKNSTLHPPPKRQRVLVSRFDDYAGKRSVPPILTSHPSAGSHFLGRPHALNAYKPPWMRCIPSARHSLPHSRPPDASGLPVHVPNPPDPEPDPKPLEHNETVIVEMSPKEAATPGSCHKRKFHDITLQPPLKRIRANSGAAVIPTTAYLIDPGDTYAVYARGQRPPPEQWYVLFELRSSPAGTRSYPPRSHPYVAYLPDPETTDVVYHMGPRPP